MCLRCELCQALDHPLRHECHKCFLWYWSTELMPAYASADAKKAGRHFFLTSAAHLSFCTSFIPYPGHHGAKQMFVHQNKWLGTAWRQQCLFCQQWCQHWCGYNFGATSVPLFLSYGELSPGTAQSQGNKWWDVCTAAGCQSQAVHTAGRTSPGFWKFTTSSYNLPVTR